MDYECWWDDGEEEFKHDCPCPSCGSLGAEEYEGLWSCGICHYCGPELPPAPKVALPEVVYRYREEEREDRGLTEDEWRLHPAIYGEDKPKRNPFLGYTEGQINDYLLKKGRIRAEEAYLAGFNSVEAAQRFVDRQKALEERRKLLQNPPSWVYTNGCLNLQAYNAYVATL